MVNVYATGRDAVIPADLDAETYEQAGRQVVANEPMGEDELRNLVEAELLDALTYDDTELVNDRVRAIDYDNGWMPDIPPEEGRSSVVSYDVRDTIDWIMPGLLRVFLATDEVVNYQPERQGDEDAAEQATDYVNYVVLRDCDGFNIFHDVFRDALLLRNGYFKFWWDDKPTYEFQTMTGLDDGAMQLLAMDPDLEVVEQEAEQQAVTGPQGEALMQATYSVRIRRAVQQPRLRICALRPENFLVNGDALDWDDPKLRFVCHRREVPRSTLIEEGYDQDLVMEIPAYVASDWFETSQQARLERGYLWQEVVNVDPAMQNIEAFECYIRVDYSGTGIGEWRRVVTAGPTGGRVLLANDPWDDDLPFADLRAMRYPHRWQGRSVWDVVQDIQRIKTVLWRQSLDNLYLQNHPQTVVNDAVVRNPDEVLNPSLGGTIRVDGDPRAALMERTIPFVAANSLQAMEMLDQVIEKRTGVSRQMMALDPDALQNQTATAANIMQAAAYSRVEMIARCFAEGGLKRLFSCILRLIVKYQDRPRTIRLRDQWVTMDPRAWNAEMDVVINTGLGTGNRDRDMAMLMQLLGLQQSAMQQLGPMNPLVNLKNVYNTLAAMTKAAGVKDVDMFFTRVDDQALAAMAQQQANQPDPAQAEAQANLQVEMAKIQAKAAADQAAAEQKAAIDQQRLAADIEAMREKLAIDREKAAQDAQLAREKAAADIQLMREEAAARIQIEREKAVTNAALKRDEMILEAQLAAQQNELAAQNEAPSGDRNIKEPE